MSSEEKIIDYYRAIYEVGQTGSRLQIGQVHPKWDAYLDRNHHRKYAIITPCNPGSRRISTIKNKERILRFREELSEVEGIEWMKGTNLDRDGHWPPEPSFILLGAGLKMSFSLAQRYEQSAFVYGRVGLPPFLVWTHSPFDEIK